MRCLYDNDANIVAAFVWSSLCVFLSICAAVSGAMANHLIPNTLLRAHASNNPYNTLLGESAVYNNPTLSMYNAQGVLHSSVALTSSALTVCVCVCVVGERAPLCGFKLNVSAVIFVFCLVQSEANKHVIPIEKLVCRADIIIITDGYISRHDRNATQSVCASVPNCRIKSNHPLLWRHVTLMCLLQMGLDSHTRLDATRNN